MPDRHSKNAPLDLGGCVETGSIEVRADSSLRQVALSDDQFQQLKLHLTDALRPSRQPERVTFGLLVLLWLDAIAAKRVQPVNEKNLSAHLRPLFFETEDTLSVAMIERHLEGLKATLSPSTINKIRGVGRLSVNQAMAERSWSAPNPFELVRRLRQPRRTYTLLNLGELEKVQAKLPLDRRRLFRCALHLGMRTGELLALRREDIDFNALTIRVHRSHGRDQTKTGTERLIPLLPAVMADLVEAIAVARSELVFGNQEGDRQRHDTKLTRILRQTMSRAGVGIVETEYICRKCKDRWRKTEAPKETPCPVCDQLTLKLPIVKPVRWYDLRHMCATLHHAAGADPLAVALLLGHSVKGTTQGVYTHPSIEYLARELSKWKLTTG